VPALSLAAARRVLHDERRLDRRRAPDPLRVLRRGRPNCLDARYRRGAAFGPPTTARARALVVRRARVEPHARDDEPAPERDLPDATVPGLPTSRWTRRRPRAVGGTPPHVSRRGPGCDVLAIPHNSNRAPVACSASRT
jgi:hypothetical protein